MKHSTPLMQTQGIPIKGESAKSFTFIHFATSILLLLVLLSNFVFAQTKSTPFDQASRVCAAPSGENSIYGIIYYDDNANASKDGGEDVYPGATIRLYADADSNGTPDAGAILTTTSDVNGEYHFDTILNFTSGGTYDAQIASSADDAGEKDDGTMKSLSDTELKLCKKRDPLWAGFRFTNITIPSNATIDSAFLYFKSSVAKGAASENVTIYAQDDTQNPSTFTTASSNISGRNMTETTVSWLMGAWSQDVSYRSPDIKTLVSEVVTDVSGLDSDEMVFMLKGPTSDYEHRCYTYDDSPANAPRLVIYYSVPGVGPYHFLMDVDVSSLPATSSITTATYQSAAFYNTDVADCNNDFGFDISSPNSQGPSAVADVDTTPSNVAVAIDVLGNDTEPNGDDMIISAIAVSPDQGGSAVINNNGTPSNYTDDFIDFTPSGVYTGNESFSYEVCDDNFPQFCDTATVTVTITAPVCVDNSTPENSPSWAFGAEWKYDDSGNDLGSSWNALAYNDDCWSYGDAELGFGDGDETTTISNHAGETYYFRKHFNVDVADSVNSLFLEMRRDDGVIVYINGTELYRSNMPTGAVTYTTLASANQSGADETAIHGVVVPASLLVDGDNVIAAEVHQDLASSSDITWDLRMTPDLIGVDDTTLIEVGSVWNYNDNGIDLGTTWRELNYTETENNWKAGPAELGYGDGGEATVIDYGGDAGNKYPTYYFRQYFNVPTVNPGTSLDMRMIRDDGAVVYINGTEVWKDGMPSTVNYSSLATQTIGGADETTFIQMTVDGSVLNTGKNVVAVEIHQQSTSASSDVSFDFEMFLVASGSVALLRGPYLQTPTKTSMTLKWRTGTATTSEVVYGTSLGALNDTVIVSGANSNHEVTLTGLTANTKYYYQIGAGGVALAGNDADHFFYTAPDDNSTALTRAWFLGDAGTANDDQRDVRDAYNTYVGSDKTDMMVLLGDNAYNDGTDAQYQYAMFEDMYEDNLRNIPVWSCPGNHDMLSASSSSQTGPYYDIFTFPTAGEAGGVASGTEAYYSWDYGQIHFISLDSDDSPRNVGGAMLNWLTSDLAATTKPWIVVIFHHPPYTKGSHDSDNTGDSGGRMRDMRENVLPILESYGVDLVLSGHSHSYERSYLLKDHFDVSGTFNSSMQVDAGSGKLDVDCSYKKTTTGANAGEGAVYITAGSSGKVTGSLTAHPAMYAYLYQMGSVVMEVVDNRMDVKFIRETGAITDYFTIDKDVVNAAIDSTVAEGEALTLTASWADDFSWSPGSQTTQSITIYPTTADTLFIVTDGNGCFADTFRLTIVDAGNSAPIAANDTVSTFEELAIEISVLSNDIDPNSSLDASTLTDITSPSKGVVSSINTITGTITYTPGVGQTGVDQFQYSICDDGLPSDVLCDTATVVINITANNAPVANNDVANTAINFSVDINVVSNDTDSEGNLDASSVVVTQNPTNGTITNVSGAGVITYSPEPGYSGNDTIKYKVSDLAAAESNEATVVITVECGTAAGTENELSGMVYYDDNANGTFDVADLPYFNATVYLYEDDNNDGSPDGAAIQATTTNAQGGYEFVTDELTYSQSFTYDMRIATSADDAHQETATMKLDGADLKFGKSDGTKITALRYTSLGIPSTATITSAYLVVNNGESGKVKSTSVNIHAQDIASPPVFTTANNNITSRTLTTNYTTFSVSWTGDETNVQTPDLSPVIQELITSYGALDEVAFIWANNGSSADETKLVSYDDAPLLAPRLVVNYTVSGYTHRFLTEVETASLPATSTLTTGTYQNAAFVAQGTRNCGNDHGFDIASIAPNDPPIAVDDTEDTTVANVALSMDVMDNDSDPDSGQILILTAIVSSPDNGGTATIENNATPSDPSDDYVLYTPSGSYTGVESYEYVVCDNAFPTAGCDTATVSVTIVANTAPVALDDMDSTPMNFPLNVYVLANDYDEYNQPLTITTITSAPDRGGSAVIQDNGTPLDPTDDYILFTPSGIYEGIEEFEYQICDNATIPLCATATVTIDVLAEACESNPHTASTENFPYGSEWRYWTTDEDLSGTAWKTVDYSDATCWKTGDAVLGFGDPVTTTITDHGGVTYYFRKDFEVADITDINYLKLDMKMDDGAVVFINGSEVFRANMPDGDLDYTSPASGAVVEGTEYSITTSAEPLVNGMNVIAVRVHQQSAGDGDLTFDLKMSADLVDQTDDIMVYEGEYWNYNDNGLNLGNTWKTASYREAEGAWETGQGELGYGDGDETTVISYGSDANNKYVTTYFRHYFSWYGANSFDTLTIKLRRDDGAVVYLNGTEMARSNLAAGNVTYLTTAPSAISGADESAWQIFKVLASSINNGANVVAVEMHQANATSSDLTFDFEMSITDGDPSNATLGKQSIEGVVFLDADVNKAFSSGDVGLGAIQVNAYLDNNNNGQLDVSDPLSATAFTNFNGEFTLEVDPPTITSVTSSISQSSDDALEEGSNVYLTNTEETSIDLNSGTPQSIFGFGSSWNYFDSGDHGETDWMTAGSSVAWKGPNNANFGFNLIGEQGSEITPAKTMNKDRQTYYFWKQFSLTTPQANQYLSALAEVMCDDGLVIYINGVEMARYNMPSAGAVNYSTVASTKIEGAAEIDTSSILITNTGFVAGTNTIAVEVHQYEPKADAARDLHFDLRLYGLDVENYDYGLRFNNITIPANATISNARLVLKSANTSTKPITVNIEGEATANSSTFQAVNNDIDNRLRTSASRTWMSSGTIVANQEVTIDSLSDIIQEIVDIPGWASGNSLTLLTSGFTNEFITYDGGYAAELTITYVDTSISSADYLIALSPEDISSTHLYMTDSIVLTTVTSSGRAATVFIGYIGGTSACVASSDDGYDALSIINRFSGKNMEIGAFGGSKEIEAIALSANADTLFAVDADQFGTIDLLTGLFTAYGGVVGTGNGSAGSLAFSDIDGLAYDIARGVMWATARRSGTYDALLVIDPATGQFVPDYFGSGVDYLIIDGTGILVDLDDIAVNPNTGNLFAMNNNNGGVTNLIEIDPSTGDATVINSTGLDDMEGQGFHNDGKFYSTSGREGVPENSFYEVDTASASLTFIGHFTEGGDFEGCDCKSGPYVSFIQGVVFLDVDEDSVLTASDVVDPGVRVYLFEDLDLDGQVTAADLFIDLTTTDADGIYAFGINYPGNFLATVNEADLPVDFVYTTSYPQDAAFRVSGSYDFSNNIGYRSGAALPVELAIFTGENKGLVNHLNWTTLSEINNDHFNVERSADGFFFDKIGEVAGAGTTLETTNYKFIDEQPYIGENYYRLKQVDIDGSSEYSNMIMLKVNSASDGVFNITTWPNPASNTLMVDGLAGLGHGHIQLRIYDSFGNEYFNKTVPSGTDFYEFNISGLKNGFYLVDIKARGLGSYSIPFIKQR